MTAEEPRPNIDPPPAGSDPIQILENRFGVRWEAIHKARARTSELMSKLGARLKDLEHLDYSIVVTGSLGRGEASDDSDADWILLVDGPSDPEHGRIAQTVASRVLEVIPKKHGRTATFGDIVPSHGLVHYIAGTRDTNENLTRRILLLAESRALTNDVVRQRVIRNVLARYVQHDRSVQSRDRHPLLIPHFLLNDVVRYWRTMASDYASKMWERNREGWGTRNIKLRFSRKLLFIWGLLASFAADLFESDALLKATDEDDTFGLLAQHIQEQTNVSPLDLLARVAAHEDVEIETAGAIFSAYNEFLEVLSDRTRREELDKVPFESALDDETYCRLRRASKLFREGINTLFFDQHPILKRRIREYGVF